MIDYLDGTLSKDCEAELLLFLEHNPKIKAEFEGLDDIVLQEVEATFDFRDGLKKSVLNSSLVNHENFEEFCIAFHEGDLNELEEEHLKNYLHDFPSLKSVFNQYSKLKLNANEHDVLRDKELVYQLAIQSNESVSMGNYIEFIIGRNEGDLSQSQEYELQKFLENNSALSVVENQVASLKLIANSNIVFTNKASLKRRALVFSITNKWANMAAASVAIFMFFYFIIPTEKWEDKPTINTVEDIQNTVKKTHDSSTIAQSIVLHKEKSDTNNKYIKARPIKSSGPKKVKNASTIIAREEVNIPLVQTKQCNQLTVVVAIEVAPMEESFPKEMLEEIVASNAIKAGPKEHSYEMRGVTGKLIARVGKVFSNNRNTKKEADNKKNFKEHFIAVADIAIAGFNKMTEADIELPKRVMASNDKLIE